MKHGDNFIYFNRLENSPEEYFMTYQWDSEIFYAYP
ncbi:hypothetical protein Echvi_0431 [Echinicola vietnamensis DSM 17526]|uniref:Uncharacterized protein n=1 Tax=Echinicola vietnamensis (strain DSM 17526 / LMG 23754 / KMM 6221) TaxID=926556 RepID=L0FTU1_ECHVK|nr:hypothetical protein Echvi_0431 [Echinicola vietnamensis DSM 17526]